MSRETRTLVDSYFFYRRKAVEFRQKPVEDDVYAKITGNLMKFMMDKILDGEEVMLGANMGTVSVRGTKIKPVINKNGEIKGVAPSWAKTRVLWEERAKEQGKTLREYIDTTPREQRNLVYCFNEHSNGIRYHIAWMKVESTTKNKTYYGMVFTQGNKRKLWRKILEGKEYHINTEKV